MESRCQSSAGRSGRRLAALFLVAAVAAGCTRPFYRDKADREVEEVLRDKDHYPAWKIEQYHVYPDPRARFADQSNPDRPPMPPDDPAAADEAPNPQRPGKAGVGLMEGTGYLDLLAGWDAENRAALEAERKKKEEEEKQAGDAGPTAPGQPGAPGDRPGAYGGGSEEFPDPLDPRGAPRPFRLKLEQAVELGLINSREFQDRRETLYLNALPVTAERFAFSTQFFAAGQLIRERLGRRFPGGPANRWAANSNLGFGKIFSTGALLLFQFANRTVLELANPRVKHTISESTINLDLIQPLLRGGGKAVALEPLTLAERGLLYEIRNYARFRKQFFVNIAAGRGVVAIGGGGFDGGAAQFGGGFDGGFDGGFGGGGLDTGTVGGGGASTFGGALGVAGVDVPPGRGIVFGLGASGTAQVAGFLPTLQNFAQLVNDQENVRALERFLTLFRSFEEGGDVSMLQVFNVESQLLQSRNRVFQRSQGVRDSLDAFKLQLGLPANLPLELDDEPIDPIRQQLGRFQTIIDEFDAVRTQAGKLIALPDPRALRERLRRLATESRLVRGTRFRTDFPRRWSVWERRSAEELRQRQLANAEEYRRLLGAKAELEARGRPVPETLVRRIGEVRRELALGAFERNLRDYEAQPRRRLAVGAAAGAPAAEVAAPPPRGDPRGQLGAAFRSSVNLFEVLLQEARDERVAAVGAQWPRVPRLCVNGVDLLEADLDRAEAAVAQAALTNRFDLMNARAQLVDAWRQIRVAANALLGTFNVEYHLTGNTPPGLAKPLAFSGSRTRHQLVLNGELPLVRILERNAYRASLIGWQRQRRALMAAEDVVAAGVRSQLRRLRVQAANYRIQQRAVEVAFLQVESAVDVFRAPPPPPAATGQLQPPGGGRGVDPGGSAALTTQLLQAQATLNNAQNNLIQLWVQYLTTRMQLYRDLELMPLDFRGVWTDDVATCECPPDLSRGGTAGNEQRPSVAPQGD